LNSTGLSEVFTVKSLASAKRLNLKTLFSVYFCLHFPCKANRLRYQGVSHENIDLQYRHCWGHVGIDRDGSGRGHRSDPAGRGQSQLALSEQWWQWALGIPAASSPLTDVDGSRANLNNAGSVFFLAGAVETSRAPSKSPPASPFSFRFST
jgi:hypothetical protein